MERRNETARTLASRLIGLGVAMATLAAPGYAQDRDLRITVYNDNLGLVSDHRTVTIQNGTVELVDVPALIDPTSVHLKGTGGRLQVLEQNFQYDLAGPDRILQRFLGQRVDLVLKEGDVKGGTLLSFEGGTIVLQDERGGVSLVQREQVIDVRLPQLPEGLRTRPTLVWSLQADGGTAPVELSYLTGGLSWHAEYVAVTNEDDSRMELAAWVSLENSSGATYPDAQLQLIAGEVHRVQEPAIHFRGGRADALAMSAPEAKMFEEESFFEYHLYTLERRTTIADRETKQVSLFPTADAPVTKIYEYRGQSEPKKVRVVLETENKESQGLGMPLPAGKVRTYKKDRRGQLQFIGEDRIDHTPKNEKIRLRIGDAFDIVGERAELNQRRISDRVNETEVEIKIRNRKEEKIEVLVEEMLYGDWEILQSTHEHTKKDARKVEFLLSVGADQETVLKYTVRTRF